MPRPESITEADIARWDAQWEEDDQVPALMKSPVLAGTMKERAYYPGVWLGEQLRELGANDDEVQEICFALGQRNFVAKDPWLGAVQALEDYTNGRINTNVPTMVSDDKTIRFASDGNRKEETM